MNTRNRFAILCVMALIVAPFAQAQNTYTWTNTVGGAQSWTTDANWLGSTAPSPISGDTVDFSTVNIVANTTLTLGADRTAEIWKFGDTSNGQDWIVNAGNQMILAGTTPTINVVNRTATLNNVLAGTAGLTKTGIGALTLNAVNTYSGPTTIIGIGIFTLAVNLITGPASGSVTLSGNGTINNTTALTLGSGTLRLVNTAQVNRFADGAPITVMGGGTISYENTSGANVYTEALGSVTNAIGQLNIVELNNQASTGSQTLTLDGLSRTGAASVTFSAASTGPQASGNKNMIVVTGAGTTDANKIIGPWATVGTTAALQTDYAIYSSDYVTGLAATSTTDDSAWTTTWADTSNYAWGNTTLGMTNTTTRNINTLRHTGGAETLTLSGANLGAYGILNSVASMLTIARSGTSEAVTLPTTSAGQLHVNTGSGAITISVPITDNTGKLTLVKNGSGGTTVNGANLDSIGTLVLFGVNTYTGDTIINAGTLRVGVGNAATGAKLGGSGGNYAGNIAINAGAMLWISTDANQTFSGNISGDGCLVKTYSGTLRLSGNNTYTGKTSIAPATTSGAGVLEVYSLNSVNGGTPLMASSSLGAPTTVENGTIELGGPKTIQGGATLRYLGPGETSDRVVKIMFGSNTSRILENNGTGLLKFTSTFTFGGSNTGTMYLQGSGNGEIVNGLPYDVGALNKAGSGTWTVGGAIGSTTTTTISGGKLIGVVGGSCSNSTVVVNNGFTFGIAVNDTNKQWTCKALSISAGTTAKLAFGFTTAPSATIAPLNITNTLTFTGTPGVIIDPANLVAGTYPLLTYGGALFGIAPSSATIGRGLTGTTAWNGSTLELTVSGTSTLPLTWKASGSGTWDINTTPNWNDTTPASTNYLDGVITGDPVVFADTYVGADTTVTLNATVKPASVTAINVIRKFTIIGTGAISGATGLTKSGAGDFTLATTNTYTGATVINGGAVIGQTGGSCNNSDVTINANSALGVRVTDSAQQWSCKSATVSTATGTSLKFSFGVTPSTTLAPLKVNGTLLFTGTPVIDVSSSKVVMGTTIPLLVCGGSAPTTPLPALTGVGGTLFWQGNTLYVTPQAAGTIILIK